MSDFYNTDDGPIPYFYVSAELYRVGHDHVVAYNTVMSNMGIRHKETVGADNGLTAGRSPAVDRCTLTDNRAVSDDG